MLEFIRRMPDGMILLFFDFFTRSSLLTLYISFRFSFKDDHKAAKRRAYIRVRRGADGKPLVAFFVIRARIDE